MNFAVRTFVLGSFVGTIEYLMVLTFDLRQPLLFEESQLSFINLLFAAIIYGFFFVLGCSIFLSLAVMFDGLCKRITGIDFLPRTGAPQAALGSATALFVFVVLATYFDWGEWNMMKLTNRLLPFIHIYSGFLPSAILKLLFVIGFAPLIFRIRVRGKFLLYASCPVLTVSILLYVFLHSDSPHQPIPRPGNADSPPNVIVIVSDALRADHLPCYGNKHVKTPTVTEVASEGSVFANAFVQAPVTGASHASLFTGLYPLHHGVLTYLEPLAKDVPTLAEVLRANGYATAAIISNMMGDYRTLGKGFEHYDDLFFSPRGRSLHIRLNGLTLSRFLKRSDLGALGHYHPERSGDATAGLAIEFLERTRRPYFLFLHFMEPHSPYGSGEPYESMYEPGSYEPVLVNSPNAHLMHELSWKVPERFMNDPGFEPTEKRISRDLVRKILALYDGDITFMDSQLGRVLEAPRASGQLDRTIIVFTSDHGECLFEHNLSMEHNRYLYDSTLHIPLIFRYPPMIPQGLVVDEIVESIDVMPTILEICGIDIPQPIDGKSLVPFFQYAKPQGFDYAHSVVGTNPRKLMFSVRSREYKYIYRPYNGSRELYYLPKDKTEANNLATTKPEVAEKYHALLEEWVERAPNLFGGERHRLSPSEAEKLKTLGYVD